MFQGHWDALQAELARVYSGHREHLLWRAKAYFGFLCFVVVMVLANWSKDFLGGTLEPVFYCTANGIYLAMTLAAMYFVRKGYLRETATLSVFVWSVVQAGFATHQIANGSSLHHLFTSNIYYIFPLLFLAATFTSPLVASLIGIANTAWLYWMISTFPTPASHDSELMNVVAIDAMVALLSQTGLAVTVSIFFDRTNRSLSDKLGENKALKDDLELQVANRTAELQVTMDKLQDMYNAKREFLAELSHEIRNPLGAVLGASELLHLTQLTEDQKEPAEILDVAGAMLLGMMEDVLDLSRMEAGKFELRPAPFRCSNLVQEVGKLLQHRASEKGLGLTCTVEDPDRLGDRLVGDGDRLRQILVNLGTNAIKFTTRGQVQLLLKPSLLGVPGVSTKAELLLEVLDTGRGMDQEAVRRMFKRFDQAGDRSSTRKQGFGLGLAIVWELVERMAGKVDVQSIPGSGTRVSLRIPMDLAG